jgi:hypothetical protein
MSDLETLLKRLVANRVEFVIVEGYAAVAHGVTLVTRDVDICCRFSSKNLLNLQRAVRDLHPVHRQTPQQIPSEMTSKNCARWKNLYLKTDLGVLDCLSEVSGVGKFATVLKESVVVDLGFGKCRILKLEALIKAKEAMGRPHDKETVVQLREIQKRIR